jgi:integrase
MAYLVDRRWKRVAGQRVATRYTGSRPWQACWSDPDTGREVTRSFSRKVDAQRHLEGVLGDLLRGEYVRPEDGRVTFHEYAERWRASQVSKPSTARKIEQVLRLHAYPVLGTRRLASVRPSDIQALVKGLSERLAPATVRTSYAYVSAVFRSAVRDRLIARTPCDGIQLPKAHRDQELVVLSPDQVVAIGAALPERYQAAVWLGVGLGLRVGELLGLTIDRVDFLRRQVKIDRQAAVDGGGLAPPKTRSSNRTIPLPDAVGTALAEHLRRFPSGDDGRVFTTASGKPVRRTAFGEIWARARTRAGLPPVGFHACRHTYASTLIIAGESVVVVQRRLGHESAAMTLDVYGHLFPDADDRTRAAIDAMYGTSGHGDLRPASDAG